MTTVVEASGAGLDAGRAYGEQCRELVHQHLDTVFERLHRAGRSREDVLRRALAHRDATSGRVPQIAEEIDGVAEGAALSHAAGWVLQLRAELEVGAECTAVAVQSRHTASGGTLAGQNVDLPHLYRELLVLLSRRLPAGGPTILTLTPAGQVGHHGMNSSGVAVFATFVHAGPWRLGVPRYLLTRIALEQPTREAAVSAVTRTFRAASRSLLIADASGASNVETAPAAHARTEPDEDGVLVHTNHLVSSLAGLESADAAWLRNSHARFDRGQALLRALCAPVEVADLAAILRDRAGAPDAICHLAGESDDGYATVASTIADTARRELWTVVGAPTDADYARHEVR